MGRSVRSAKHLERGGSVAATTLSARARPICATEDFEPATWHSKLPLGEDQQMSLFAAGAGEARRGRRRDVPLPTTRAMRRRDAARAFVALFALACVLYPAASLEDRRARLADVDDAGRAARSGGVGGHVPDEKNVQGLIQAGFPRARAEAALRAVGNDDCCAPQMKYLFEETKRKAANTADAPKSSECHMRPNTDYDGFAVKWGGANLQDSWEACCKSCQDYVPEGDGYPCNVWVYCPEEGGCFAPAAGDFVHKQCWLKWQEEPENPHVNMRGEYSEEYRATHPTAPERVQWIAGSVVPHGTEVSNGTWSSRSHWK